MVTAVTKGVTVMVETEYQPEYSSPSQYHYVFTYRVTIKNGSSHTIQLLRRKWYIHDTNSRVRVVEGEGVVGQQPIIEPGEQHQYISGCNLKSGIGKMHGHYEMEQLVDGARFQVNIPEFQIIFPNKLN